MRSAFWCGAIMLALGGAAGLVVAHQAGSGLNTALELAAATQPQDDITGSIDKAAMVQLVPLTDEQRGLTFVGVMALPGTPEVAIAAPEVSAALPRSVKLQDLPAAVIGKIPELQGHKFVKLHDRILVVRAKDRVVVSEIPRYRFVP